MPNSMFARQEDVQKSVDGVRTVMLIDVTTKELFDKMPFPKATHLENTAMFATSHSVVERSTITTTLGSKKILPE